MKVFCFRTETEAGELNFIFIYLNGDKVGESKLSTFYKNQGSGAIYSLGSRTIYLELERGDTLSLKTSSVGKLYDITLCLELVHSELLVNNNLINEDFLSPPLLHLPPPFLNDK